MSAKHRKITRQSRWNVARAIGQYRTKPPEWRGKGHRFELAASWHLFFAIDAPYSEDVGVDPGFATGNLAHLENNVRHWRNWDFGGYFNDDWKVSKRLSLNLGLRYDLYTRSTELNHLTTTFIRGPGQHFIDNISTGAGQIKDASAPCPGNPLATLAGACGPGGFAAATSLGKADHNNVVPRVGFAWDTLGNGKTSLRGGFGMSSEGNLQKRLSLTRWNPPYYSLNHINNFLNKDPNGSVVYGPVNGGQPSYQGPASAAQHSGTGPQATGNISGWNPNNPQLSGYTAIVFPEGLPDPYIENWFLGIQRELRPKLTMEVNYVGTAGRHLYRADDVNRIPSPSLQSRRRSKRPPRPCGKKRSPQNPPNGGYWRSVVTGASSAEPLCFKLPATNGATRSKIALDMAASSSLAQAA